MNRGANPMMRRKFFCSLMACLSAIPFLHYKVKWDYDLFVIVTIHGAIGGHSFFDSRLPGKWRYLIKKSKLSAFIERESNGGHEVEVIDVVTKEYTRYDHALSRVYGPHKFERGL
jgi:hypothetical protein